MIHEDYHAIKWDELQMEFWCMTCGAYVDVYTNEHIIA